MTEYNLKRTYGPGGLEVIAGELKFPETGKSRSEEKGSEWGWKTYALWSAINFLAASSPVYSLRELLANHDFPYRNELIPINGVIAAGMLCVGVFNVYYAISSRMKKSTQND